MRISEHSFDLSRYAPVCAAILWLVGFCFALMPLQAFEAEGFMVAFLCAAFAMIFIVMGGGVLPLAGMLRTPLVLCGLAFWGVALLSVVFSAIPFVSFIYFCFFSVFPLSFFMVVLQGDVQERVRFFKIVACGCGVIFFALALSGVVQYFFMPQMLSYSGVHWPLSNPNSLAALYVLGLWGALGWVFVAQRRLPLICAYVLFFPLFLALLVTESRGALLSFALALPLFAGCTYRYLVSYGRRVGIVVGMMAVAIVIIAAYPTQDQGGVVSVLGRTISGDYPVLWSRLAIWQSAWQIFMAHPWTGTGVGTFFLYYPEMRMLGDVESAGLMVHNDPLQFAVEMGVGAFVLFYVFMGCALWQCVRVMRGLGMDDQKRIFIMASLCALGGVIVHSHVSFHFHVLSILMILGLVLGFLYTLLYADIYSQADTARIRGKYWQRWALVLSITVFLAVFSQFQVSQILSQQGRRAMFDGRQDLFIADINRAGKIGWGLNGYAPLYAVDVPMGILQLNAPFMPKDALAAMVTRTENLLNQAEQANPRLPDIAFRRAELIAFAGAFNEQGDAQTRTAQEEAFLLAALRLDPLYLPARVRLAHLYIRNKRAEEAYTLLKAGLDWRYRVHNPDAFLTMLISMAVGRDDEAVAARARDMYAGYFGGGD